MAEKDFGKEENFIDKIISKLAKESEDGKTFSAKYSELKNEIISKEENQSISEALEILFKELSFNENSSEKQKEILENINKNIDILLPEVVRKEFDILLDSSKELKSDNLIELIQSDISNEEETSSEEEIDNFEVAKKTMNKVLEKTSDDTEKREDFSKKFLELTKNEDFRNHLDGIKDSNLEIQNNLKNLNLRYKEALEKGEKVEESDLQSIELEIEQNLEKFEKNIEDIIPDELKEDFNEIFKSYSTQDKLEIGGILLKIWAELDKQNQGEISLDEQGMEELVGNLLAEVNLDGNTAEPQTGEIEQDAEADEGAEEEQEEDLTPPEENKGYHSIKTIFRKSHYEFSSIGAGGNKYLEVVNRLVIDPVLDFGLNGLYQGWDGILNATENFKDWRRQKEAFNKYVEWMKKTINDPDIKIPGFDGVDPDQMNEEFDKILKAKSILGQNRQLNKSSILADKENNPFANMDALKKYWNERKAAFKKRVEDEARLHGDHEKVSAKNEDGEVEYNYAVWGKYPVKKDAANNNKILYFEDNMENIPEGMYPGMPIPEHWDENTPFDFATLREDTTKPLVKNGKKLYKLDAEGEKIHLDENGDELTINTDGEFINSAGEVSEPAVANSGITKTYDEDKIKDIEKDFRKEAKEFFDIFSEVDLLDLKSNGKEKEMEKVKSSIMDIVNYGQDTFNKAKRQRDYKEKNLYNKISNDMLNAIDSHRSRG